MKKNLFFYGGLLVALPLVLSGCGSAATVNSQSGSQSAASTTSGRRMPDYGQPSRPSDVRGLVKSIIGNQATILELPAGGGRRASSTPATANSGGGSGTAAPAISLTGGAGRGGFAGGAGGGGGGGGFAGGAGGGGGGFGGAGGSATARAAMIAQLEKSATGEETITIPVGIQMLKSGVDSATQKRTMVAATLTDVTADKIITVWLNPAVTDQKVAQFVLIN